MIQLVIEATDSADLRAKVVDLCRVICACGEDSSPVVGPAAPQPAGPEGAAESEPEAEEAPAPPTPAEIRTTVRQLLAPVLAGPKAADVVAMLKQFGGNVTKCPDDRLADLLENAKAFAEAA